MRSFCLSKHHHESKSEAAYCNWLLARQQNGEIEGYKVWPSVNLPVNGKPWRKWKIDFLVYENDGTESYHECKGYNLSDGSYRLKRDLFLIVYPKIKLYVNKELYTGKPNRQAAKWTIGRINKINRQNKKRSKL